jgi:cytochrome c oxidase cbb3-type subunit 4
MDFTEVRIVWTVASFVIFIAILVWACSKRASSAFDAAARLPFADDAGDTPGEGGAGGETV